MLSIYTHVVEIISGLQLYEVVLLSHCLICQSPIDRSELPDLHVIDVRHGVPALCTVLTTIHHQALIVYSISRICKLAAFAAACILVMH